MYYPTILSGIFFYAFHKLYLWKKSRYWMEMERRGKNGKPASLKVEKK